jgi:hypothetical protein
VKSMSAKEQRTHSDAPPHTSERDYQETAKR